MLTVLATSPNLRVAMLALTFLAVIALVILADRLISTRAKVAVRLKDIGDGKPLVLTGSLRENRSNQGWAKLVETFEKSGVSLVDSKNDELRARMIAAGYDSPLAPKIYTLARLLLILVLPSIFVMVQLAAPEPPSFLTIYLFGSVFALMGLFLPTLWISARVERRKQEMVNGFPDCLDLMLVCVEAGLGLEAALDRVGREMLLSHPLVARMLSLATMELRAGANREQALRNMADRVQVEEIRAFATLLIQSDKLGSSIATTLRIYAGEMREKRRMRAEEKAHRLPVLLSVPLVACMLPAMIGVLMLPAAIRVVRILVPAMSGG